MLSITESILNEGNLRNNRKSWEILQSLSCSETYSKFNAPDEDYLYISTPNDIMVFTSLRDIEFDFDDSDMKDEFSNVKRLRVGESWAVNGEDIYIRLR